jgi:hypothetical protein
MSSSHFGSPLAIAAHHGLVENVKILVEDGKADANALLSPDARGGISFGPSFGSALEATVTGTRGVSSEIIIRYLVTRGEAEVDLQTIATYGSALAAAAAIHHGRYRDPLGPMIELGANVNLPLSAGEYGSALIAAAASGSMEKVRALVIAGADVNAVATVGEYGSALIAAAVNRNIAKVRTLVAAGANVNAVVTVGKYGSAVVGAESAASLTLFGTYSRPEQVLITPSRRRVWSRQLWEQRKSRFKVLRSLPHRAHRPTARSRDAAVNRWLHHRISPSPE